MTTNTNGDFSVNFADFDEIPASQKSKDKDCEKLLKEKDNTIKEMSLKIIELNEAVSKTSFQKASDITSKVDDSLDKTILQNIMVNQTYIVKALFA